jgi:hypothetical protein
MKEQTPDYYRQMGAQDFRHPHYRSEISLDGNFYHFGPCEKWAEQSGGHSRLMPWKFRISVVPQDVSRTWNIVLDELIKDGEGHYAKAVTPRFVSAFAQPGDMQRGKMITIYTFDYRLPEEYFELMRRIEKRLRANEIYPGQKPHRDKKFGDSDYFSYRSDRDKDKSYIPAATIQRWETAFGYNPSGHPDPYERFKHISGDTPVDFLRPAPV